MPRYFVYDADTGQIVHIHETYDTTSGESLSCTQEEVLALVDESLKERNLAITEADITRLSAGQTLRVDTETKELVQESRGPSAG
jgi:hypothetical protein